MKSILKKSLVGLVGAVALAVPFAGIANAGAPQNPGGFGKDRAAGVAEARDNPLYDSSPGASYWGRNPDGASGRAGDNGTINRAWMEQVGATPTP